MSRRAAIRHSGANADEQPRRNQDQDIACSMGFDRAGQSHNQGWDCKNPYDKGDPFSRSGASGAVNQTTQNPTCPHDAPINQQIDSANTQSFPVYINVGFFEVEQETETFIPIVEFPDILRMSRVSPSFSERTVPLPRV